MIKIVKESDKNTMLFNNLLINRNSTKYQPFLLNLTSGRRRLLYDNEIVLIKNMIDKKKVERFNNTEKSLYNKLILEKQFITDENRDIIDRKILKLSYFENKRIYSDDYRFSIELTNNCNMSCSYCYVKSRRNKNSFLTKGHIDSIYNFYTRYADNINKVFTIPYIRITGGEPLFNKHTVQLINYIAMKWDQANLILFTNGVNLLKYYDYLPLSNILEVHVSIDGTEDIHMDRRLSTSKIGTNIYNNIIAGVKKLIDDKISVKIKTVIDNRNYKALKLFKQFLDDNNVLGSKYSDILLGFNLDFQNPLDICDEINPRLDIPIIRSYVESIGMSVPNYPSYKNLFRVLNREKNKPYIPRTYGCNSKFLGNYYFACNGLIYYCDCISISKGIIGRYHPDIMLDKKAISKLLNRNIYNEKKCITCDFKYICLGGCILSSREKNVNTTCGIFSDKQILENIEFNYNWIEK